MLAFLLNFGFVYIKNYVIIVGANSFAGLNFVVILSNHLQLDLYDLYKLSDGANSYRQETNDQ